MNEGTGSRQLLLNCPQRQCEQEEGNWVGGDEKGSRCRNSESGNWSVSNMGSRNSFPGGT